MRIIAGELRGRKLLPPAGLATRPITDRVKQSLFDILAPDLPGARVYDCFAGTGSMGLESLSRGARSAVFFETDRPALARLRANIETLSVGQRAEVVATDLFRWFAATPAEETADVVFLDPPYRFVRERRVELDALAQRLATAHLSPGGIIIFRHDAADTLEPAGLARYDQRTYGSMAIDFLRAAGPSALP